MKFVGEKTSLPFPKSRIGLSSLQKPNFQYAYIPDKIPYQNAQI